VTPATCANCAAPLTGPYCAQCGQHAHDSARTLAALAHDGWHVITHLDGRFWRTLRLLLLRPGQLTLEYFADRRARYVPPVRLYLVISVLFFGLASMTGHFDSRVAFEGSAADRAELEDAKRAARDALEGARTAADAAATAGAPAATGPKAAAEKSAPATSAAAGERDPAFFGLTPADCERVHSELHWLEGPLRSACRRNVADHGRNLLHAFFAGIPRMMFVFLPIVAALMLLLYWFPRRLYVEHLVFVLHNHAALFLAMTLQMLLTALGGWFAWLRPVASTIGGLLFFYALWYVYRAMRRFYGQGRWLTLAKYWTLALAYVVFLGVTMLFAFFISALIA
jgi:hypothetical protein